jgi:hypothetical protein
LFLVSLVPAGAQDCGLMPIDRQKELLASAQLNPTDLRALSADLEAIRNAAGILETYGQDQACAALATALAAIVEHPTIIEEQTRAAFLSAEPIGAGGRALAATDLLDRDLTALNGRLVGKVEDLWLDADNALGLVLVSLRGPLGIGAARLAVPFDLVRFGTGDRLYLGLSTGGIESAPRLEDRSLLTDEAWRAQNGRFYAPLISALAP